MALTYAKRFILPLLLLAASVGAWFAALELGTTEIEPATASVDQPASDLAAPLASVRRLPEFATNSLQADAIATALADLPPDPGGLSCVAVLVDGRSVLERRTNQSLVPSYAQLLITGHTAIDVLGSDYRYETRAMAQALPDDNGVLRGGLYLIGGGDPVLMTFGYSIGFRPILNTRTPIEDLAQSIADANVQSIEGGIIAIERRYDTQRRLTGWPDSFTADGVVGPLSALQVNDGFSVSVTTGGGTAIAADFPATHAADRLEQLLEGEALQLTVSGTKRTLDDDEEIPELVPVASIESPTLDAIVFQMLAANDAGSAELIIKELGVADSNTGTTQAGAQAVQRLLQSQGVTIDVPFRDGSGIDPIGGTTCAHLASTADTIADDHPTLQVLPAYNLPGVFDGRLRDVDLTSDLRLVGGVQGDASGYVARTVDAGRRVTIASIVNRPGGPSTSDLEFQQALVEIVDELRSSITVEAIAISD